MADFTIFRTHSGFAKMIQLLCLLVSMSVFFSLHSISKSDQSSSYYVTAMMISPFLQTLFLLIVYVFGGLAIQKTLYEFIVNSFYTLMIVVAAIVLFVLSNLDNGAVAAGIFALLAAVAYGADTYFALVNMGVTGTPGPTVTDPYPPPPVPNPSDVRTQPFTPPPTYNPPPSLAGSGQFGAPRTDSGSNVNPAGDLGSNRI